MQYTTKFCTLTCTITVLRNPEQPSRQKYVWRELCAVRLVERLRVEQRPHELSEVHEFECLDAFDVLDEVSEGIQVVNLTVVRRGRRCGGRDGLQRWISEVRLSPLQLEALRDF